MYKHTEMTQYSYDGRGISKRHTTCIHWEYVQPCREYNHMGTCMKCSVCKLSIHHCMHMTGA